MENYNELLEKAKEVYRNCTFDAERKVIESIFPEIVESEDEKMIWLIKTALYVQSDELAEYYKRHNITEEEIFTWLKKQGDKKHPNSKEDERLKNTTISFLKDFANNGYENAVECIDWLDALKPQSNWKPTTEQMQTLHAQLIEGTVTYPEDKRVLTSLYEDLMKIFVKN